MLVASRMILTISFGASNSAVTGTERVVVVPISYGFTYGLHAKDRFYQQKT